jgi:hybrid cluster-associated redox disulfide protein
MATITADMTIEDVVKDYPETIEVFFRHGLACVGCHAARYENIEQGAMVHGMELEKLLKDLNEAIEKKE